MSTTSQKMIAAALELRRAVEQLDFSSRVPWVYNPLHYAWRAHQQYLEWYTQATCRVVFLGMNPGPWGMAQCGIPFGEVERVKNWLHIDATVDKPEPEHPKRPVAGLACPKSEVSGKRLWGLMSERFASAQDFSQHHFVANYCPLVFMEQSARNVTPDTLPAPLRQPLEVVCDRHLSQIIRILNPEWVIGVGSFAEKRAQHVVHSEGLSSIQVGRILHPSPASPAANKGWSGIVTRQLSELGVW